MFPMQLTVSFAQRTNTDKKKEEDGATGGNETNFQINNSQK